MQLNYYIPILNPTLTSEEQNIKESPLSSAIIELANGENNANDIIGKLLVKGYDIGSIMKALKDLKEKRILIECPQSDLSVFSEEELSKYERQLKAITKLGFDKTSVLLPYSASAISHQRRIKEGIITIVGDGATAFSFIENLIAIGIGTIHFCARNITNEEEQVLANRLEKNDHNFSNVYIHRLVNAEIDAEFLKSSHTDVVVYLSETLSRERALAINEICKSAHVDFLPYQSEFPFVYIGPFYLYKQSACYNCYLLRKEGSMASYTPSDKTMENCGLNVSIGLDTLTLEVLKYYSYITDLATVDKIWTYDITTGISYLDTAFKLPRCPLCGISKIKPTQKLWESI